MIRRGVIPMFLPALVVLAACGGTDSPSADTVDAGLDAPDRIVQVQPEAVYRIGGFDAPDWASFGDVDNVAFDSRGHLFILDGQTNVVTEVDASGEFVRTIGRPGEGPGELSSPFAFTVVPSGGIAVFDLGHRGWVVYDAEGEYVENVQVDMGEVGLPGGDVVPHPAGGAVGSVGGRIRMSSGGPSAEDEAEEAPSRPIVYFALESSDSSRVVYSAWDMPEPPEGEEQSLSTDGGGNIQLRMPVLRAFEPGLHSAVLPDGRVAVVDSIGYRVKIVDLDGTVTEVLERPIPPTEVTASIQEQERERREAEMAERDSGGGTMIMIGGGGSTTRQAGGLDEMMRARIESMIFAEEIPTIEQMAADGEGRIWVQRSSGVPGEDGLTDLLSVDGRYLGSLPADGPRIPSAFGPDGLTVRIERDEFDVPTLIVERMPAEIG